VAVQELIDTEICFMSAVRRETVGYCVGIIGIYCHLFRFRVR